MYMYMYMCVCVFVYMHIIYTQARAQTSAKKAICKLKVKTYKLPKVCALLLSEHACGAILTRKCLAMITHTYMYLHNIIHIGYK